MSAFEKALGRTIARERARAGLSQEALAGRAKLHPTYISQVERGLKSPTLRAFLALAKGLGVQASELLRKAELAAPRSTGSTTAQAR